ncbi:MAG TPA: peptidylprolyl isomerase [Pyrinomonadaceae bacterium]|nr:peptidylprolyl isomerase [Pyrinomonadaceae bacterium]
MKSKKCLDRQKCLLSLVVFSLTTLNLMAQVGPKQSPDRAIPGPILIQIIRSEDQRRWDDELKMLLTNSNPAIRSRAALATGRIGSEDSVPALVKLLSDDTSTDVRATAAFALGEVESITAADMLIKALKRDNESEIVQARIVEALGKIAAALPKEQQVKASELGEAVIDALKNATNRELILLGVTALLRSHPANAGPILAQFETNMDPRIRADAANALARLRAKDANDQLRILLKKDPDAVVRANAARVLGATEDKASFESLLERAINDADSRVRVSAIRSLASLKDPRAAELLVKRGTFLSAKTPIEAKNEVIEIATTLGRLLTLKQDQSAHDWLSRTAEQFGHTSPEIEQARVRVWPDLYLTSFGLDFAAKRTLQMAMLSDWHSATAYATGLREFAALPDSFQNKTALSKSAVDLLRDMLAYKSSGLHINTLVAVHSEYAVPEVLRALAAFKPLDLDQVLRSSLKENDVIIRATAAELLGELPASEVNTTALVSALSLAKSDQLNDATLSTLDALGSQKNETATTAVKSALDSPDFIVRQRAAAILKTNGAGDFASKVGPVQSRNSTRDYQRAISRIGQNVRAVVTTSKGSFTIELLPNDAPLNVDNFLTLAQKGYFRNITFHRVVPNFVIQGGDPRGDGNGGPGYQIRCEINEFAYDRGAVGMALSGKDTGGSQWFVTHSPQPHLDGGYTVFGKVIAGLDVVDNISRGDVIQSIRISTARR